MMKRREFVGLIAGAALYPLVAKAQDGSRRIGALGLVVPPDLLIDAELIE